MPRSWSVARSVVVQAQLSELELKASRRREEELRAQVARAGVMAEMSSELERLRGGGEGPLAITDDHADAGDPLGGPIDGDGMMMMASSRGMGEWAATTQQLQQRLPGAEAGAEDVVDLEMQVQRALAAGSEQQQQQRQQQQRQTQQRQTQHRQPQRPQPGVAGGGVGGAMAGRHVSMQLTEREAAAAPGSWAADTDAIAAKQRAAAAAAYHPAAMLTYGKDGKVKTRTVSAAARPMPLMRTSVACPAPARAGGGRGVVLAKESAAPRQPLMERASQVQPTLKPPVGASPGELRLWKMQNGIPV